MHRKFEVIGNEVAASVQVHFYESLDDNHRSVVTPKVVVEGYLARATARFQQPDCRCRRPSYNPAG